MTTASIPVITALGEREMDCARCGRATTYAIRSVTRSVKDIDLIGECRTCGNEIVGHLKGETRYGTPVGVAVKQLVAFGDRRLNILKRKP